MDENDIPDTRIFVSGLPPNLTSEQLGAHFAMRYQVTDAVVVPGRRIGFVGFRNYTLAKNAVKYFDKSYIRLSKISVEIAKPIEIKRDEGLQATPVSRKATKQRVQSDEDTATTQSQPTSGSGANAKGSSFQPYVPLSFASTSNKRKREGDEPARQEGCNNFMDIIQTSRSNPTWSNGTDGAAARTIASVQAPQMATSTGTADTSSRKLKKKDKRARKDQNSELSITPDKDTTGTVKRKNSKMVQETHFLGVPGSKNAMMVEGEDIMNHGEEATGKRKQKKGSEMAPNSNIHRVETEIEREQGGVLLPNIKRLKEPKSSKEPKGGVNTLDDASGLGEDDADRIKPEDTRADSDWLRERTSRVLDLVGGNEFCTNVSDSASQGRERPRSYSKYETESQMPAAPVVQHDVEGSLANGRLFIRNMPYSAKDVDIQSLFSRYGKVDEVHIVQDPGISISRGLAYVQYRDPTSATRALQKLDGASFQGRLLHIIPALDKKSQKLDEYELSKLPLKKQKEIKRRRESASNSFSWNSLYMNPDAVLSSAANRLGVTKAEVLDPTSSDAAVKQAHAETHVIQETKSYLKANGINVDAFKQPLRDDRTLLVKNFPFGVTTEDLRQLFEPYGHISHLLMPPTGTMAVVRYSDTSEASHALKQLAYKNLKGLVLFLEKGPRGLFQQQAVNKGGEVKPPKWREDSLQKLNDTPDGLAGTASSTLFVRNLNFATTSTRLKEIFEPLAGFLSARVKTKTNPKRPGEVLSVGYGFVCFHTSSQAQAAMAVMNGHILDNHELMIEASRQATGQATDAASERRQDDIGKKLEAKNTKIVIKNLPFEASKKDIQSLFGAYGQLRSVRVPKKFDHSTRGFAFADFVSAKEAENAIIALTNTHLLGRRLVLEFASGDAIDPEDEIRAMERRISQQTNLVNLSQITDSGRKKFTVDARDDEAP